MSDTGIPPTYPPLDRQQQKRGADRSRRPPLTLASALVQPQAASGSHVCSSHRRKAPPRLRKACSFNVSSSRTPPAVADTRMRCASFFFMSAILSSLVKSGLAALNSFHVASKAAVSVLRSCGPKYRAYSWKGLALPQVQAGDLKLSVTVLLEVGCPVIRNVTSLSETSLHAAQRISACGASLN
jgi:hypothetical protein